MQIQHVRTLISKIYFERTDLNVNMTSDSTIMLVASKLGIPFFYFLFYTFFYLLSTIQNCVHH